MFAVFDINAKGIIVSLTKELLHLGTPVDYKKSIDFFSPNNKNIIKIILFSLMTLKVVLHCVEFLSLYIFPNKFDILFKKASTLFTKI